MMTVSLNRPFFAYFVGLLIVGTTTWTFDTLSIWTYLSRINDISDIAVHPSSFSPQQTTPTIDDDISEDNKHLLHEFRNYLIQDHNHDDDDQKTMFLQGLTAALQQQESNHNQNEGDESSRSNDCPLDWMIFNSTTNCIRSDKRKSICTFEGLVFKRINAPRYEKYYNNEKKAFQVLKNETKFFPKLYYMNDRCSTMIIEDIKPFAGHKHGMKEGHNYWTADYSYYEDFFIKAFDVFNYHNVHPNDLNTCCNTIVDGEYIKIFDFDKYHIEKDKVKLAKLNEELLKKLLTWIKEETMEQHEER